METVHVLLLEDHEGEARLNQRLLERSYTTEFRFTGARTLAEAVHALASERFDVALLDLNVPDSQGIETFRAFQAAAPRLPVVIVSATADERLAQTAILHGAQDYLVKGSITSELLTRVVRYAIARKNAAGASVGAAVGTAFVDESRQLPPSAAFILDDAGRIVRASPQLAVMLGQQPGAVLIHRPFDGFFLPLEGERIREVEARVRRGLGAEHAIVRAGSDAGHRYLVTFFRPDEADATHALQGNMIPAPEGIDGIGDGTQLAMRYRTLVDHSQDGVFILSDGKLLFVNGPLADMLGCTISELEGSGIDTFVAPEDVDRVLDNYRQRVAGQDVEAVFEINLRHKSGSRLHVQFSVGRIELGSAIGIMGTVKNLSETRRVSYLMRLQHRLAVNLAHAQGRSEIYEYLLQGVLSVDNVDIVALYLRDQDSGRFQRVMWRGVMGPFPAPDDDIAFNQLHDRLAREGAVRFLDASVMQGDRLGSLLVPQGIRSFGVIPVADAGACIAAIDVASLTIDAFDESVQRTLESIASFLGGVLARVNAEDARKESELLYRAAVEKSHDAIFIYRGEQIVFVNEVCAMLTGYTREELLALNPWSLIHPEDRERIQGIASRRLSAGDAPLVYEGRVLKRDGTIRTGEFAATIIRYQGEAASLVTVRDVTARKSQEEELRRSDALIRAAGLSAERFLRSTNWQDCIMEVLERVGDAANVCRVIIFENLPDERGKRIMRQRAVWIRPELRDSMIDRVPDGQSFEDKPFRRWASEFSSGNAIASVIDNLPDEEQIFLARQNVRSVAMLPVFAGERWWGIMRFDECRLRRTWLRSEIEAMSVSAETLGAAIRREMAEQELMASRERALQAEAIKNAFIANISHEVRTPVNIILGYLALVEELAGAGADGEMRDFIKAINDASHRLIRTVDAILNISRFQSRDIVARRVPIRLDKLLAVLGEESHAEIEGKGLQFAFVNRCGPVEILGDEYFLGEAFDQLLDNAIKFTPSGSIKLSLVMEHSGGACVSIEDTGIGISEHFLEKVFDPYIQEDMGYNRRYEGIGLGLTLVKIYLEAQGASIAIHSVKGEGTRCDVRFPAQESQGPS